MWRALVRSGRLGSGCLVLHVDTRENPGGKNGVMTGLHDSIHNVHNCINEKIDYHILSKIRRAFRRSVPFLKIFEGPTLVGVIIALLVEDDLTLYTMVTIVPTKR
jgi:hypothetical protein